MATIGDGDYGYRLFSLGERSENNGESDLATSACDKTGKRPDCGSLSEEIKKACNENGEKLFKKEEWLSSTQIKGFIASYLSRKSKLSDHDTTPPPSKKQSVSRNECVLEEVTMEDDEKLNEIVTALETDDYNENMNNMVDNVFLAINIQS
ncbi:Hypothetical predicted protein [Mytilus galloprovincialis]|uniref:Uncharacterized protein n=1 Tax=Mytilus galloprovincialis TaxID=29158 RepID=A0A8B6ETG2_MYTGA|nr:Hypothetical predicted protein [Mytilus galloprovincialis]